MKTTIILSGTVALSSDPSIKADNIEASFDRGVLKITLPKKEEAKKKNIEVKVK